jgi:hypothetical protein
MGSTKKMKTRHLTMMNPMAIDINSNRVKDIIQCNEMVKVACVLKGVVRAIKADQRFFNSITAG